MGLKGRIDAIDFKNNMIYDWKFGYPNETPATLNQIPRMVIFIGRPMAFRQLFFNINNEYV